MDARIYVVSSQNDDAMYVYYVSAHKYARTRSVSTQTCSKIHIHESDRHSDMEVI